MEGDTRLKAVALETRGRVLTALGRDDEARRVLDEARVLNESSDDGEIRSLLALSLVSPSAVDWRLGRRDEANAEVARAITLFSDYHGPRPDAASCISPRTASFSIVAVSAPIAAVALGLPPTGGIEAPPDVDDSPLLRGARAGGREPPHGRAPRS